MRWDHDALPLLEATPKKVPGPFVPGPYRTAVARSSPVGNSGGTAGRFRGAEGFQYNI